MDTSRTGLDLSEAVPLVFELASLLQEAGDVYEELSALATASPERSADDVAVRLNVSRRDAELLVNGATFNDFLAARRETEE